MAVVVGVAVLGVISGISLEIRIAIAEFLMVIGRRHFCRVWVVPMASKVIRRHHKISGRTPIPRAVLFRWDAPPFFANAEFFRERVLDAVAKSPTPVRWPVVAAEPVTSVDVPPAIQSPNWTRRCTRRVSSRALPN